MSDSTPIPHLPSGGRAHERDVADLRHELCTPINHIIGYGEIMLEDAEDQGCAELIPALRRIVEAGHQLLTTIGEGLSDAMLRGDPVAIAEQRHELRTRIACTIGVCEIIEARADRGDAVTAGSDVDRVMTALRQLLATIEDRLVVTHHEPRDPTPPADHPAGVAQAELQTEACVPWARPVVAEMTACILVVDDSEANRDLLARLLAKQGYSVEMAEDGKAALRELRTRTFDLVLLDIMMPVMDGYQVLQALKDDPVLCAIPVIMLSALDQIENVVKCIQLGAEDYLTKPLNPVLLKARIEGCLERRRARLQARKLGCYTLERRIGSGGMGEVYLASHALLRRPAAIKLLLQDKVSEKAIAFFEREVQLTSQLTHPNTVAVYDYGRTPDGLFYYVMEYIEGMNLDELVEAEGVLPDGRTCHVLRQVCASLAEAHDHGLIHRDIKPANIMLCQHGGIHDFAKLLDFGIAQELASEGEEAGGRMLGTPAFMAPEAIRSPEDMDGRSDLYALGCVGYYLLTGMTVFDAVGQRNMLRAHLDLSPVPPSKRIERRLSPDLEKLILRCLAKDKADRPGNARELAVALAECRVNDEWRPGDMAAWWERFAERRHRFTERATAAKHMAQTLEIAFDDR